MLNKLFSISLIGVLTLPLIGTYSWLTYQKYVIRHEVKQKLIEGVDPSELVQLKFSIGDSRTALRWEHAGEFEYNDQMYDVVKADTLGDTIIYFCWWDHAETLLNIKLERLTQMALETNQDHKEQRKNLVRNMQLKYLKSQIICELSMVVHAVDHHTNYNPLHCSIETEPTIPPPKTR